MQLEAEKKQPPYIYDRSFLLCAIGGCIPMQSKRGEKKGWH